MNNARLSVSKTEPHCWLLFSLWMRWYFFEEDTPIKLITTLQPDVLVKSADYQIENIVGAKEVIANGGEVKIMPFVEGLSTTTIIDKIIKSTSSQQ